MAKFAFKRGVGLVKIDRYQHLDAKRDHEEIVKWMVVDTWKFDLVRATEIALLKTFAFPEISKILVDSGEFLGRSQKRYDDTDLLLSLFIENGYSSPAGMKAIQKINRMHAPHPITNHQMLYVLSTFVVEPIVWIDNFGWRKLRTQEREALFYFWIEVGKRMGIKDLFASLDEMLAYHERYERERMVFDANNAKLYQGMTPFIAGMMPFPIGAITQWALPGIMSVRLCAAFGVPPRSSFWREFLRLSLKLRGFASTYLPSRPFFRTKMLRRTYPEGYTIHELGVSPSRGQARRVQADAQVGERKAFVSE